MSSQSIQMHSVWSTFYGKCKVVKYNGCKNITVQFLDTDYQTVCQGSHLRTGRVRDVFVPTVQGIGYLGEGRYSFAKNHHEYGLWTKILERGYDKNFKKRNPTYVDCKVSKRWHNFQNFVSDIRELDNWNTPNYQLDKDLRVFGNKIYGRKYCSFVPRPINNLYKGNEATRGKVSKLPLGVSYYRGRYKSQLNVKGKGGLGVRDTIEEAHTLYCKEKAKYLRQQAETYKSELHPEVYKNLIGLKWRDLYVV